MTAIFHHTNDHYISTNEASNYFNIITCNLKHFGAVLE